MKVQPDKKLHGTNTSPRPTPTPPPTGPRPENISYIKQCDAVVRTQESARTRCRSPSRKRRCLVSCNFPFTRLAEHLTVLGASRCLVGETRTPSPGIAVMRGSMALWTRAMHDTMMTPPPPLRAPKSLPMLTSSNFVLQKGFAVIKALTAQNRRKPRLSFPMLFTGLHFHISQTPCFS